MTWQCPKCGSRRLTVSVVTTARLTQRGPDDFETEIDGDQEWDGLSSMACEECNHVGEAATFEVGPYLAALQELAHRLAAMAYDGEEGRGPGGGEYIMENDDAVTTLSELIHEAREITGVK